MSVKSYHLAFDQAIINTGCAVLSWDGVKDKLDYVESHLFSSSFKWGKQSDAFIILEQSKHLKELLELCSSRAPIESICMEGISFGSPGMASSRGAIWGLYVTTCMRYADTVLLPPRSLKLFSTGNGKAEKKDMLSAIHPKYKKLEKLDRKIWDDEYDALGLCEAGFWAWRIMNEGIDKIAPKLKPHELEVLWNLKISGNGKPKGICNRTDDFYLVKTGKPVLT